MLTWLKSLFTSKPTHQAKWQQYVSSERFLSLKAKYDAAQRTTENQNHWANADALSAAGANTLGVRKTLRERSRYEVANNCHARGITLTVACDLVGTGPVYQAQHPNEVLCDAVQSRWIEWADGIGLAEKLFTFGLASIVDGEAVAILTNEGNPLSSASAVQLNLRGVECDRLSTPTGLTRADLLADGIEYDSAGNPAFYHILKYHPGDYSFQNSTEFTREPARNVLHFYRQDRPEQLRGIPELTPALPLFAQLRRYTLAVLMSAEIAADFSLFITTDLPPDESGLPDPGAAAAWDVSDVDRGMITQLPYKHNIAQLKAEQPTTMHDAFCKTILHEVAHCMNIPYNVATGDFSQDSYAGGRMALQVYQRFIKVRRHHLTQRVLNRIHDAWFAEAIQIPGYLPRAARTERIPYTWFFPAWGHVDPTKESSADQTNLMNFTRTLSELCAENGTDWRKVIRQRGAEIRMQIDEGVLILPPGTPPLDGSAYGASPAKPDAKVAAQAEVDTVLESEVLA